MNKVLQTVQKYCNFLVWAMGDQGKGGAVAYLVAFFVTLAVLFKPENILTEPNDGLIFFVLYPLSLYVVISSHYEFFFKKKGDSSVKKPA